MVSVVGNSLTNLAVACAREIGPYFQMVLTSLGATGSQFVSTQMIDTEAPTSRYAGYYAYSHGPSVTGEQHRVTQAGFTGSTGAFATNGSYSAQPAANTTFSLLGSMPMISQDGLIGLRECLNRSLRKRWVNDRYPITSTGADVVEYDLGAAWFISRQNVKRLLAPAQGATILPAPSGIPFDIVTAGDSLVLQMASGFPAGDVFYLGVDIPANARLYSADSAAWSYQSSPTAGVTKDGDACLGTWNQAYQCMLYEVMRALEVQAAGARKAYWAERAEKQGMVVSALKIYQMDGEAVTLGEGPSDVGNGLIGYGDRGFFTGGGGW